MVYSICGANYQLAGSMKKAGQFQLMRCSSYRKDKMCNATLNVLVKKVNSDGSKEIDERFIQSKMNKWLHSTSCCYYSINNTIKARINIFNESEISVQRKQKINSTSDKSRERRIVKIPKKKIGRVIKPAKKQPVLKQSNKLKKSVENKVSKKKASVSELNSTNSTKVKSNINDLEINSNPINLNNLLSPIVSKMEFDFTESDQTKLLKSITNDELLDTILKIKKKEVELGQKENELGKKEVDLTQKEVELTQKEVELTQKEVGLQRLEIQLQRNEVELERFNVALDHRAFKLQQREAELRQMKNELEIENSGEFGQLKNLSFSLSASPLKSAQQVNQIIDSNGIDSSKLDNGTFELFQLLNKLNQVNSIEN